tara:strand:- start:817 stop:1065 length:249 start_codon:yes stop_codon:yes gene_type:complete
MSVNERLEKLCYDALVDGPKTKIEINKYVVDIVLKNGWTDLIYGLNNLGFRIEKLKKIGVKNTAKCKDANEGLLSKGTWYIS